MSAKKSAKDIVMGQYGKSSAFVKQACSGSRGRNTARTVWTCRKVLGRTVCQRFGARRVGKRPS